MITEIHVFPLPFIPTESQLAFLSLSLLKDSPIPLPGSAEQETAFGSDSRTVIYTKSTPALGS